VAAEHLDISRCPRCNKSHRYRLAVERSYVMKLLTPAAMTEPARQVRFTRLFLCPTKNDEFEATFILTDTSSTRIRSVTVGGSADDNNA
jgi:hypothetical protein